MTINHQVRLAARPVGMPDAAVWDVAEGPVADPGEGEVVVKVDYVSINPAMRAWINESASYIPPVELGGVMRAVSTMFARCVWTVVSWPSRKRPRGMTTSNSRAPSVAAWRVWTMAADVVDAP